MLLLLPLSQIAATAFVAAWALRLGGFLVMRVWKTGHDSRFDEAKHKPFTFWIYWTMQVGFLSLQVSHVCLVTSAASVTPAFCCSPSPACCTSAADGPRNWFGSCKRGCLDKVTHVPLVFGFTGPCCAAECRFGLCNPSASPCTSLNLLLAHSCGSKAS
jgi:hypothetical protein